MPKFSLDALRPGGAKPANRVPGPGKSKESGSVLRTGRAVAKPLALPGLPVELDPVYRDYRPALAATFSPPVAPPAGSIQPPARRALRQRLRGLIDNFDTADPAVNAGRPAEQLKMVGVIREVVKLDRECEFELTRRRKG